MGKQGAKIEEFVPPPEPAQPLTPEESREKQKQQAQDAVKRMQARMEQRMKSGQPRRAGFSSSGWTGITMTQLAERLASLAGGPVVDETGLAGKYNAYVETWQASDDDPGQTVFDALALLGLKMAPRKQSVDYLIVDKIAKTPTAN